MSSINNSLNASVRRHPKNKIVNDQRFVNCMGEYLVVDAAMHYQMYLIMCILAFAFGPNFLVSEKKLKLQNMVTSLVTKNLLVLPRVDGYEGTNTDVYVLDIASDLETLILSKSLDDSLKIRLKSGHDGEIRGALHEIKVAAAFVRLGYKITWLKEPSRPEFIASRGSDIFEVEAKRRNRSSQHAFSMTTELSKVTTLLKRGLKKQYSHKYIIVIDTDLPPKSVSQNISYYNTLKGLIDANLQPDRGIIILNNGYEYQPLDKGAAANSYLAGRAKNGPAAEVMNELMFEMYSDVAPAVSVTWMLPGMRKQS